MLNELNFRLYHVSDDTKIVIVGSKLKEKLGITI